VEQRSFDGGVHVSVVGVGCGRVGFINNLVSMREIEATLEAAVEAGVNLFDTANIYGHGDSERTLSRLLRRHRDRMFVVTKVGGRHGRYAGVIRLAKPLLRVVVRSRPNLRSAVVRARTATVSQNFSPLDLRRAIEASRRRLALDRLDGLLLHDPSPETLSKPEIHDFLGELLRSGQAARVGASVDSLSAVEVAVSIPTITMLQVPLTLTKALAETAVLERIRQRNIGLFVRGVLRRPDIGMGGTCSLHEMVSAAISPDYVTAAIIGVSTRQHLNELLSTIA
jgi:aryl-alcohol dehydrogenase-like predicted oxidoreductase